MRTTNQDRKKSIEKPANVEYKSPAKLLPLFRAKLPH